jgi:GH24 family phage-related lysozyme (muramidase)
MNTNNINQEAWMHWLVERGVLTLEQAEDALRRIAAGETVKIGLARRRNGKTEVAGDGTAVRFTTEDPS